MLPRQLRVGDFVDDYCPRERRLSNHGIVALVGDEVRQVRCTTCDAEHEYRGGKMPVSRRKKPVIAGPAPAQSPEGEPGGAVGPPAGIAPIAAAPLAAGENPPIAPAPDAEDQPQESDSPRAEISFHRRLIRATLPRVEGDTPARPIPEFTMHRPAPSGHPHRFGKPFRPGQGGGQHRTGGKAGFGQGRPGGPRHGQGEANGNTAGSRGGHGPQRGHGAPGSPQGARPPRHGFGGKPPRGPKKH